MNISNIPLAQQLVGSCKAAGVKHIVISPGSRNAPLTLSFTEAPFFKCFSIVDERSAGFFAMGMAQQLQEPVVLVCTSGSAVLNYYPAIAEAFYSRIPLIVISADRPAYKVDIGDGQVIRQKGVYANHIGYSVSLRQDVSHATETYAQCNPDVDLSAWPRKQEQLAIENQDDIFQALQIAWQEKLPVHLNAPFEEPLYGLTSSDIDIPRWEIPAVEIIASDQIQAMSKKWQESSKKLVLIGSLAPGQINQSILEVLANDPSVLVLTETTANVQHPNFVCSIDSLLVPIEKSEERQRLSEAFRPDIVLSLGGMLVSKKIKALLRDFPPKSHWQVGHAKMDTFFALDTFIKGEASAFLESVTADYKKIPSDYRSFWLGRFKAHRSKRETYLKALEFSDFKVHAQIYDSIPEGFQLQLSNSSTIRYAQLFDQKAGVSIFCNRGTSGIEGSTSTAVGAAYVTKGPSVLVTGDLSFFYDSNAFWNAYVRPDFRVILINNGGGGIFRILPGDKTKNAFETYFETTHGHNAQSICQQFGFEYLEASNQQELGPALKKLYEPHKNPVLLEVSTPRIKNDKILLEYFDFLS
ncbi:2-succinyl-5-enolpyruvyl-6-hydroxy-3-cyclohexene-1-carboxylic-acid synthase [Sediminicola luteus]|uniref:2-succinyl-5-enolpyruvyl-6-hydroxy-3-cyclohexene-1-carboxylate synthase n=1 Tax=Sediminicola luteus TaxID=319238 RepID=A0A2A4G878_9FLAO|nr:2-succinyl-5-enolpyruvyl-6-hydroxy-3-cyclohexene-1-carboxylic-acid synthase [Sediminicola luteus]PCE64174.1 2-succinyl-5-enolpyruvyl-6-hydroxy-3-cyclohexene-1-carboxylic-acid synthase [Sediminicola luteus]